MISQVFRRTMKSVLVSGFQGKENKILVQRSNEKPLDVTVFFGGDIQDFEDRMMKLEDTKKYIDWSLERTSKILHQHYPRSNIITISPSCKFENFFSCYENFVKFDESVPILKPNHNAINHLYCLLKNLEIKLKDSQNIEDLMSSSDGLLPIRIIGFSKGCCVLNQIINEIHFMKCKSFEEIDKDKEIVLNYINVFKEFIWLDGGHNGTKDTWITDSEVLHTIAKTSVEIQTHVTPYQIKCKSRPWIGQEYSVFVQTLKHFHANLKVAKEHFLDQKGTIKNHFNILVKYIT